MYSVTLKRSRWTQLFYMVKYNWRWMLKDYKRTVAVYVIVPVLLLAFLRLMTNRPFMLNEDAGKINEEAFPDLNSLCSPTSGSCVGLWYNKTQVGANWEQALTSFKPVSSMKSFGSYSEILNAATHSEVQLGVVVWDLIDNKANYKVLGKHSTLLKYGAPLQNLFDVHLINFYRKTILNNTFPQIESNPNDFKTVKLPFVKRDLITFYALAVCVFYLFICIAYLGDLAIQVVRDRVSGFRLIMEVAGFSGIVEVLSIIVSNVPVALIMALVVTIFEYATGNLSHVSPLESFPIFLLGFLALIPCGFFISIRSKGNSYIVIPLFLSIFGLMGVKDDFLYGTRFVTIFQTFNYVFTPGTFASLVGRIYESEYINNSEKLWSTQDFRTGMALLFGQFVGFTIVSVFLHLLLPGNITPKPSLINPKKKIETDTGVTVPTLQLRLGNNTFKGTTKGVRHVDLDFNGGQAVALLGHNGAGKSTLISLLCGARAVNEGFFKYIVPSPSSSEAQVYEMSKKSTDIETFRDYLGFCPQHNALRDDMSAYDHLEFIAAIRGVSKIVKNEDGIEREVTIKEYLEDILEKLELTYAMHRPTRTYSGGMLRKTCLAVSLVGEPSILILDEFTTGMDIVSRSQLWGMLKKVTRTNNRLVLFSTHDMEEAEALGDMVAVVSRGKIQAYCTPPELKSEYSTGMHFHIQKAKVDDEFNKKSFEMVLEEIFELGTYVSLKETNQSITYVIPLHASNADPATGVSPLSALITHIMINKEKLGIADFDISTESLERVFMEITERTNVPEENEKRIMEKGKRTLDDYLDFLEKLSQKKTGKFDILWMRIRQTFVFSVRSSLVTNGGVIFAAIAMSAIFVMFANLLSNGDKRAQVSTDYNFLIPVAGISATGRGYSLLLPSDSFPSNSSNFTFAATSLIAQSNSEFSSYQGVRSCILDRNRPLAGWDIPGDTQTPAKCIPGFKISEFGVNMTGTPKLSFVVDDGTVPFANGDRFAHMIQRMYSLTIFVLTIIGGKLLLPIGFTTNQPTYDLGILVNILNNNRQIWRFPKYGESFDNIAILVLRSGYSRIWDGESSDTINSLLSVPLYVMSQSIVFGVVLQLLHKEYSSGLTHHLLIHGLPPFLYKLSAAVRSLISSVFFFIIVYFGLTTVLRDVPLVQGFISIPFQGTEFSDANITNQMIAAVILFHLVSAAAANVFATLLWRSAIMRRLNIEPSAFISFVEYFSMVVWAIFRWFTPLLSRTVTSCISIVNPIWTLQEMFLGAFAISFYGETNINMWIPSFILGAQFMVFAVCTAFDLPRDTTTINNKVELRDILIQKSGNDDKAKEVGERVLGVDGLKFSFAGGKQKGILDGVTFDIARGECFALLGRNGAGKSTTMKCLLGQLRPSSGTATALSHPLIPFRLSNIQGVLGYCPQDDKVLMPGVSIIEHFVFYCAVKGIPPSLHAEHIRRAFYDYELPKDQLWYTVQNLSGGTKRKLSLALACLGGPDLAVLDEPSAGVDVLARSNIWNIILQEKKDKALLITTHIMEESESLSDRIGFLANGKLQINEDPVQLKSNLSKTYDISITYSQSQTASEKTSAAKTVFEYVQMHIDKDAVLSETLEGSVLITVSIGVVGNRKDVEKSEWIKLVLDKLETGRTEKDVSKIEEYSLTQRSMIHLLFDHVGEMKDDDTVETLG